MLLFWEAITPVSNDSSRARREVASCISCLSWFIWARSMTIISSPILSPPLVALNSAVSVLCLAAAFSCSSRKSLSASMVSV